MKLEIWDDVDSNMIEKECTIAGQILKQKKLNGRRYKEWVKSLTKAKDKDSPIKKERCVPDIEVNVSGQKDSIDNETVDLSCSTPEILCFRLKRVKYTSDAERSSSPDCASQNGIIRNDILESHENVDESKLPENASGDKCKSTISDFVEYWVPVKLSRLQTEQYCSSLLSNSMVLCSPCEYNTTKILHEILLSTKKCCDHPYLVDRSLHASLMEDVPQSEQLSAQIKLSGKLLLLHKALLEIKKRGLRVLILYQTLGGYESITTGDILDDIIHEEFGRDSYIRIDGEVIRSKRRAVLASFNDQKGGKLVCLMEIRACVPSIKLKSVDVVFFFNSDCDPMNDLKALQRINLDSQFQRVKVFRLYTAFTVEEKVLMLTKQGRTPEGNQRSIKRTTYHELLNWGAYSLFKKLDDSSAVEADSIVSFVENVFQELCSVLPNSEKTDNLHTNNTLLLEVKPIGGVYPNNLSLLGEAECPLMDNFSAIEMLMKEPPYLFWMNILQGRKPRWKCDVYQPRRSRKCAQSLDDSLEARVGDSQNFIAQAEKTACETHAKTKRARSRRHFQDKERKLPGETAAFRKMETPTPQTMDRASNMMKDTRAEETPQVTHSEVLQCASKVLEIEMERLQKQKIEFLNQHKDMKLQTRMECEREIDRIQKKYEAMLKEADIAFMAEKEALEARYNKVCINKALAESSMQEVTQNGTPSDVTTRFVVEQTHQLISQMPISNPTIGGKRVTEEEAVEASPDLHLSNGVEGGCLRATAPHLRQKVGLSPPCTVSKRESERPGIIYSPVSLEPVASKRCSSWLQWQTIPR